MWGRVGGGEGRGHPGTWIDFEGRHAPEGVLTDWMWRERGLDDPGVSG